MSAKSCCKEKEVRITEVEKSILDATEEELEIELNTIKHQIYGFNSDLAERIVALLHLDLVTGNKFKDNLDKAKGRCLEYGYGIGTNAIYLMQRGNKVWIYDYPDSELIDYTLRRIEYYKLFNNFYALVMTHISLSDEWFDFVSCLNIYKDPVKELEVIHRIMKKGALLFLQVPKFSKYLTDSFHLVDKNLYRKVK